MRLALASAAMIWFAAILTAPFAIGSRNPASATGAACVYVTGSFVCHQRPERSFQLGGRQMPVCARCAGLYAAAAVAAPLALFLVSASSFRFGPTSAMPAARARWIAFTAALPTIVTWLVEYVGSVRVSNTTRFVAALPLGFAVAWLVLGLFPHGSRSGTKAAKDTKNTKSSWSS